MDTAVQLLYTICVFNVCICTPYSCRRVPHYVVLIHDHVLIPTCVLDVSVYVQLYGLGYDLTPIFSGVLSLPYSLSRQL